MGKSGQRYSQTEIIDKPELESLFTRFIESSITAALWLAWLYWILPVFTIILWLFGIRLFYYGLFEEGVLTEIIDVFKNGGIAIIIILLLETVWINYNYRMIFKKWGERRKFVEPTTDEELAQYFNIDLETLTNAKKYQRIEVNIKRNAITVNIPSPEDLLVTGKPVRETRPRVLGAHFPTEFMASALAAEIDHPFRIKFLLRECQGMNIEVLPPDIKRSEYNFTTVEGKILTGIGAIQGIGKPALQELKLRLNQYKEANTIQQFYLISNTEFITKKVLKKLVKSGALDSLEGTRREKLNKIREFYL